MRFLNSLWGTRPFWAACHYDLKAYEIGAESTQISEGIRFAISLPGLEEDCLRPYSIETARLIETLLHHARDERLGRQKLTPETIDISVLLWLQRKGLTMQALEQVEKLVDAADVFLTTLAGALHWEGLMWHLPQ
ncbi:hypothetical protein N7517_006181 [Penicillium concentricum]|uniref:Uncharacterized protein n=1 Tax=Penicillium concentricum TaxID=293559 RepID=A0A9W9SA13_9EURO|nr:uncharacterized protein N7517_006181 [Penicillium concentricum]KAJ5374175.1 hypothetical protein N7517_006181 [Penicillium concentricum]